MNRKQPNILAEKKRKFKLTILALLLVLAGMVWYYFQGYKETEFVLTISFVLGGAGGLILVWLWAWKYWDGKVAASSKDSSFWNKEKLIGTIAEFIVFGVVITFILCGNELKNARINYILNNEPTKTTFGVMNDIKISHQRGQTNYSAVIEYAVNGVIIQKIIPESINDFKPGEKYAIKYSVEYPEMCHIYR